LTWSETVMHFKVGPVQTRLLEFLLASLEVIRRGHWNFYRYIRKQLKENININIVVIRIIELFMNFPYL
jgi:hypothetical protein